MNAQLQKKYDHFDLTDKQFDFDLIKCFVPVLCFMIQFNFRREVQLFRSKNVSVTQITSTREPASDVHVENRMESEGNDAGPNDSHSSAERASKRNTLFHSNQSKWLSTKIISW